MTIPEVRNRLHEMAQEYGMPELDKLADELKRKFHGRSARVAQRPVTPALAAEVRAFVKLNPTMTMFDVGHRFNINQGRVSEILFGHRV